MIKKNLHFIYILTLVFDIFFVISAYLFSFWFRFYSDVFDVSKGIPLFSDYLESLVLLVIVYLIVFHFFHLYKKEQIFEEYYGLFKSTLFVFFAFMTFTFLQREVSYSRLFIALSFVFTFLFVALGRFILNHLKRFFYTHGYFLTRAILISTKEGLDYLSSHITYHTGYLLVEKLTPHSLQRLESITRGRLIDEIIIHLPREQQSKLLDIIHKAGYKICYTIIPHSTDLLTKHITPSSIGRVSVLKLELSKLRGSNLLLKRLFDFFLSLFLLVLLSPLFLLLALLIKLVSPRGPVFYKQERVSYNYKSFRLYKFRTMIPNAERLTGPKWAEHDDSRIFSFGKFLRRTNLDELPQLLNVFLGHMSLVGPRPERPFFIEQFKDKIPHYLDRHAVKGGMTGWAQVNGYYGNTSLDERIKHDIFYIENWSLFFDFKILLRTIKLIFFRKH